MKARTLITASAIGLFLATSAFGRDYQRPGTNLHHEIRVVELTGSPDTSFGSTIYAAPGTQISDQGPRVAQCRLIVDPDGPDISRRNETDPNRSDFLIFFFKWFLGVNPY